MSVNFQDLIWSLTIISFLSLLPLGVAIFFVVLNRRNNNLFLKERELIKKETENQLLRSRVEIQELTLKTISQEIHDNIGQLLSLVKLNLHSLSKRLGDDSLHETYILISQVISDLRNLNSTFNPDFVLRDGVMAAIDRELAFINRTKAYQVEFKKAGDFNYLGHEHQVMLFRMVQEILQNAVKHSKATEIKLQVEKGKKTTTISVSDNGCGFSLNTAKNKGMGISNLESRAKLLHGNLSIFSYPGAGTNVSITVPNDEED